MGYSYPMPMDSMSGEDESFFAAFMIFYLIVMIMGLAYSILVYVLNSLGMYRIAKRRAIHHSWLAWIPFGSAWILGSIADQYQYVTSGKIRNRRKTLLTLQIVCTVMYIVTLVLMGLIGMSEYYSGSAMGTAALVWVMLVLSFVYMGLAIALTVIHYIALHNLYTSCSPNNAVMFTVLGIVFNVTPPFFVFALRNKDEGMPPRRVQVPVAPWTPASAAATPAWQQPAAAPANAWQQTPAQAAPVDQPPVADNSVQNDQPPTED